MSSNLEILTIRQFVEVLDQLDISYAIGGSIASSVYGQVRFTQDADMAVSSFQDKITEVCLLLKDQFYISEQAVQQAHRDHGSFNVIHLKTAFKIDVFVSANSPFQRQLIRRGRKIVLDTSIGKEFTLVSPEDVILLKLQWYQQGGEVSEKQWTDIQGVLVTQGERLDQPYLKDWAKQISVDELLEKAIQQSKE